MTAKTNERIIQLDALRGIAAIWVVLFHLTTRFFQIYPQEQISTFSIPDGRHGVHLFFMISGYVILMTLDKCKSLLDFAVLRFCRLFPTYWLCVIVTFCVVTYFGLPGREVPLKDAFLNLTMVPEALGVQLVDNSYWSLQVELFFYTLMGILVFSGQRKNLILILSLLIALDLCLLIYWNQPAITLAKPIKAIRLLLNLRFLHLFLFGMICYERKINNKKYYLPLLLFCILCSLIEKDLEHFIFIALVGIVFFIATNKEISLFQNKMLLFLGYISYPLYLIHQNISYVVIRTLLEFKLPQYFAVFFSIIISIILATLASNTVEHPFNLWLRKQYKNKKGNIK